MNISEEIYEDVSWEQARQAKRVLLIYLEGGLNSEFQDLHEKQAETMLYLALKQDDLDL